jgi:hypothetical protein
MCMAPSPKIDPYEHVARLPYPLSYGHVTMYAFMLVEARRLVITHHVTCSQESGAF